MRRSWFCILFSGFCLGCVAHGLNYSETKVGLQADGKVVIPTNQVLSPEGRQTYLPFRANDLALSPDGKLAAVLGHDGLVIIETASGAIREATKMSKTELDSGGSYKGIAFTPEGHKIIASNLGGALDIFTLDGEGVIRSKEALKLEVDGKLLVPSGFALTPDAGRVYVTLCISNELAEVDLSGKNILRRIPVGNMPFDVRLDGSRAYVSNFGGALPGEGDAKGPGGDGAPVKVDPVRFIASQGTVSIVDLNQGAEVRQIEVGLHPSGLALAPSSQRLFVANANSDTVSVIDTKKEEVIETIPLRPNPSLIFGSAPNDLVVSLDERRLYVSNGTNNAVGVVDLAGIGGQGQSRVLGFIPVGWYPAGIELDAGNKTLWVANIKGVGSLREVAEYRTSWKDVRGGGKDFTTGKKRDMPGQNSHDHVGSVSRIPVPRDEEIVQMTGTVIDNNRMTESISALAPPRPEAASRPVPERHGEPSVFEHVVYIIKENRTYDQIFGDIPEADGDPALVHFGEEITPNSHKLVREFVLMDNFYCSGVLSADGHQWSTEAYTTSYLEKAFGGFPRSYPFAGGDSLAYASSGFLWDNCLAHGKTFRTYGEFVKATIRWKDPTRQAAGGPRFLDCYQDWRDKKGEVQVTGEATIASLVPHTCTRAIGFPSIVSDQYRADVFIEELKQFEVNGGFPNLSMILLPNDHTSGTRPKMPTPRAAVADNDLALGRVVEAISASKFWPKTCIFVVEDDPQAGLDHIDGHRTVAMVISPYTKRKEIIHTNYNQTGMVRTIELILGLPPMNQIDSSAVPMTGCFMDQPDLTPYTPVPNRVPLDEINPEVTWLMHPEQRRGALVSEELPLDDVDEAPEDVLNRILWHYCKGYDVPYPEQYALVDED